MPINDNSKAEVEQQNVTSFTCTDVVVPQNMIYELVVLVFCVSNLG